MYAYISPISNSLGHRSLVEKADILHRDISENNVMISPNPAPEEPKGFLIDLDLAKYITAYENSGASGRAGTQVFMAIEVLKGDVSHTLRHDLESFFWLFLWICATKERKPYIGRWPNPIQSWTESPESARTRKWVQVTNKDDFDKLLDLFHITFNSSVKQLAREIKRVLFPLWMHKTGGMDGLRYIRYLEDAGYDNVIAAFDRCLKDNDLDRKVEGC